jgi:hypothetical protein
VYQAYSGSHLRLSVPAAFMLQDIASPSAWQARIFLPAITVSDLRCNVWVLAAARGSFSGFLSVSPTKGRLDFRAIIKNNTKILQFSGTV